MIILEILNSQSTSWRTCLVDINQIAQILGSILIAIYVIYTYKTFLQIKKQTDYMHNAYLSIDTSILKEIELDNKSSVIGFRKLKQKQISIPTKYIQDNISQRMTEVLKNIFTFDDNLYEGNYFTIHFVNYGNSEVNLINLDITLTVNNSEEVAKAKMLKAHETHNFHVKVNEIVSRNGEELKIPIISTASFPIYKIHVKGEYYDIRQNKYQIQDILYEGKNEHFLQLKNL